MRLFFTVANNSSSVYYAKIFKAAGHEVYMGDYNPNAIGKRFADKFFKLLPQDDVGYIIQLENICRQHDVDLLIPASEGECIDIANHADILKKNGTIPIIINDKALTICANKHLTYSVLQGVPVPEHARVSQLCSKPEMGSGSKEFKVYPASTSMTLAMEYLEGEHYDSTLIAKAGHVLHQSIRTREQVVDGTITQGRIVRHKHIEHYNLMIAQQLDLTGYVSPQWIDVPGRGPVLVEINPRWSTSLGIEEYMMSIDLALGNPITPINMDEYIGTQMIRYWDMEVWKE